VLDYKNFFVRILSGIVYIAILMFGLLINSQIYLFVYSLILVLLLNEFYSIVRKSSFFSKLLDLLGGLSLFIGSYLYFSGILKSPLFLTPFVFCILMRFIYELYQSKEDQPIKALAFSLFGQLYLSLPFSLMTCLVFVHDTTNIPQYHFTFILALFLFIWINDSFAYLIGSLFGKHKLFERISPKKSWEGFIGGALFAIIASIIYSLFYPSLSLIEWIVFALITVIFGTFGDLIESLFKRSLKIKDSGRIIPGHGGFLDRLDSFIFSLPALFIYINLILS